jgi:hypothetical protein
MESQDQDSSDNKKGAVAKTNRGRMSTGFESRFWKYSPVVLKNV